MFYLYYFVNQTMVPVVLSLSLVNFTLSFFMILKFSKSLFLLLSALYFFWVLCFWSKEMLYETLGGSGVGFVNLGFKGIFYVFIMSEIMFFFSLFWFYYNIIFGDNVEILKVSGEGVVFLGTLFLLLSSFVVTDFHHNLNKGKFDENGLSGVIMLGLMFLVLQLKEFKEIFFNMSDGVEGSVFFLLTGFHGFHVMLGLSMFFYFFLFKFKVWTFEKFIFFDLSVIYWHFVDVVWLFLFMSVYF